MPYSPMPRTIMSKIERPCFHSMSIDFPFGVRHSLGRVLSLAERGEICMAYASSQGVSQHTEDEERFSGGFYPNVSQLQLS